MASTSPDTSQSGPSRRSRRAKRASVLVLAALGVGLAGGTAAYAASSTPAPTPTAGSTPSATPGAHHGGKPRPGGAGAQGVGGGVGARHSRGGGPHGGKGGKAGKAGKAGGTITALTASTLTVALADNTSRTYTLSSATTVHQGPAAAVRSALAVGEHVRVRASDPAASIPTALDVDIRAPHVNGRISAVGADTLTVVDPDGFTRTVHTTAATSYTRGGQATSRGALTVGTSIRGTGTVDADHTDLGGWC